MSRPIRSLQSCIHDNTIRDLIAAHLYAITMVADDEEVLSLELGPSVNGVRSIDFSIIKNKEAELIVHS